MTTKEYKKMISKARSAGNIPRNWVVGDVMHGPHDVTVGFENPNYRAGWGLLEDEENDRRKGRRIDRRTHTKHVTI